MTTTLTILAVLLAVGMTVLHVLSVFASDAMARLCTWLNIAVHIAMFTTLLFLGAPIDISVLIFMLSALLYSMLSAIRYRRDAVKNASLPEEVKTK